MKEINVSKGIAESLFQRINIPVGITGEQKKILLGKEETLEQRVQQIEAVEAPVEAGEQVGSVLYTLHGEKIAEYNGTYGRRNSCLRAPNESVAESVKNILVYLSI